jgi:hypothetical protein
MFPSPKTSYMEANTQKDKETCEYVQNCTLMRLEHGGIRLEHVPCALSIA